MPLTLFHVCSYLGYGLMAARARVIEAGKDAEKGHPCFGKGVKLTYSYAGKDYQVGARDTVLCLLLAATWVSPAC